MNTDSLRKSKVIRSLALLAVLLCNMSLNAQFYSKRSVLFGGTSNGFISSLLVVNDTIYAMCAITDTIPPYKAIGTFNVYDKHSVIISKHKVDIPSQRYIGNEHNGLLRARDGGFIYGGYCYSDSDNSLMLLKFDKEGNQQWSKIYSDSGQYLVLYVNSFAQDVYSNYYVAGIVQIRSTYLTAAFIAKIDSNANLIYKKVFSSPNHNFGCQSVCVNQRQHAVLIDERASLSTFGGSFTEFYEFDTNGTILQSVYSSDSFGPFPYHTVATSDGYISVGIWLCARDSSQTVYNGNISRFDSNFHQIWSLDLGPCGGYNTAFLALQLLPDSNYLAVGKWYDPADTDHYEQYGWLVKFTADGTILWDRRYRGVTTPSLTGDESQLLTVGLFSDNTIIAAGEATDHFASSNSQQGWLLHLDADGCLPDSNSCGVISGVKEVSSSPEWAMHLYPDPASDRFTLDYQLPAGADAAVHLIVTDALGREVYKESIPDATGSILVPTSSWSNGLYYCTIFNEAGLHLSKSVSVMH